MYDKWLEEQQIKRYRKWKFEDNKSLRFFKEDGISFVEIPKLIRKSNGMPHPVFIDRDKIIVSQAVPIDKIDRDVYNIMDYLTDDALKIALMVDYCNNYGDYNVDFNNFRKED